MIIVATFLALFATDNAEFFKVASQQKSEGYVWTYVGKSTPSGTPAITINPQHSNEYILWRLEK
jgi:hypothetical protein